MWCKRTPKSFDFENLGKILENPGKITKYLSKISENPGINGDQRLQKNS